jgi:hypothetical protein
MSKVNAVEALRELLLSRWESHYREHLSQADAIKTAHVDMDRRLAEMNRFREQMAASDAKYIPRTEYDSNHKALELQVASLTRLVYIGVGGATVISGLLSWFFSKR